jgi:hypothetical protein
VNAKSDEEAAAMALNAGSDINDGQVFKNLPKAIAMNLTTEEVVDHVSRMYLCPLLAQYLCPLLARYHCA